MKVGYLGPAGTFTEEAARGAADAAGAQLVPYPTIRDAVDAVLTGAVERSLVPIENSLEGTVNPTVDAISAEAGLSISGEEVLAVTQCLVAREEIAFSEIHTVHSHPQALAQCAHFLRRELPHARQETSTSTAEAIRALAAAPAGNAAIGSRFAAALHGGVILREAVEDEPGNQTRFAWLGPEGSEAFPPRPGATVHKTSVLFAGEADDSPGWLVRCLSEFAFRGVNLVKIESRPARSRLGHYFFLVDCQGSPGDARVDEAVERLRAHCFLVRVLGSYPAAPSH